MQPNGTANDAAGDRANKRIQSHLAALKSRFAASVERMNEAVRATIGCFIHTPMHLQRCGDLNKIRWLCSEPLQASMKGIEHTNLISLGQIYIQRLFCGERRLAFLSRLPVRLEAIDSIDTQDASQWPSRCFGERERWREMRRLRAEDRRRRRRKD